MKLANNNTDPSNEVLACRWYAGHNGMPDYVPATFCNAFGVSCIRDCAVPAVPPAHTQFKPFGPQLSVRALNAMLSVVGALIERRWIAALGSCSHEILDNIPCHCLPPYDPGCDVGSLYGVISEQCDRNSMTFAPRGYALSRFHSLVHDIVKDYAAARTNTNTNFGSIFPSCPYGGDLSPWTNCSPLKITDLLGMLASDSSGGVFTDITQRTMCDGLNFDQLLRFAADGCGTVTNFASSSELWRPALRHVAGLYRCLAVSDAQRCKINGWFSCIEGNGGRCTLDDYVCANEPMRCWQSMMDAIGIEDCHYCNYFAHGCGYRKFNPFAVTLAMAILASFRKYQVTNQNVGMGKVVHFGDCAWAQMKPHWNSCHGCWCICTQFTCGGGCFTYPDKPDGHVNFGIGWCSASMKYGYGCGCMGVCAVMMYDCRESEGTGSESDGVGEGSEGSPRLVKCYFKCNCFDKPYRTLSQPGWRSFGGDVELSMTPAFIHIHREHPYNYDGDAGDNNNMICLDSPSEDFPAVGATAVRERIASHRSYQAVRFDFHKQSGEPTPSEGNEEQFGILQTGSDGTPSSWVRHDAFYMFNQVMLNKRQENYVAKTLCDMGYGGYAAGFRRTFDQEYLGFGCFAQQEMKGLMSGSGSEPVGPPKFYDRIRLQFCEQDPSTHEPLPNAWYGGMFTNGAYHETYLTCANLCQRAKLSMAWESVDKTWTPKECGWGTPLVDGTLAGGPTVNDSIQFGGYFQVVEWNFKYLKICS